MHQYYKDILDRIDEPPTWFDDNGVPRFGDFSPRHLGNIYASEAALAEIACQFCGRMFKVALTDAFARERLGLSDEIRLARVHYGDPPNVNCCAGVSSNSVMRTILEYWYRDYEVSSDWRRNPTFEGPVAEVRLDPPDTIAEVLAAARVGAQSILVMCTSRRNRYDLAGRVVAAMANNGRVLVAYPHEYLVVARKMLDGLVPDAEIGYPQDGRTVTLVEFARLEELHLAAANGIVVLAGPPPKNKAAQEVWNYAATRFKNAGENVQIEFALAHSCPMSTSPNVVIDAGRIDGAEEASQP